MARHSGVNNSIQKTIKYVYQTFHQEEQTMQWFGLTLYSISQWKKKALQLIKSEANFLSVTEVECLQPTVKLNFVAVKDYSENMNIKQLWQKHTVNFPFSKSYSLITVLREKHDVNTRCSSKRFLELVWTTKNAQGLSQVHGNNNYMAILAPNPC